VTVNATDLSIDVSVSDTHPPSIPLSHPYTLEKVLLSPMPASLSNLILFSSRDDREAFRRCASQYISLLSGCLSTILAHAFTYMSQVETYRICVSTSSTSSTIFYERNACAEDSRLLAHPAYRRAVQGTFSSLSASYRGRGQYHGCTEAV
jgi:hypothetical protein